MNAMDGNVYRIAKWDTVFERAESRKLKQLTWVAMPTAFSSHGYQSLLDEFDDRAATIYGCWCALVAVAASCAVRGVLATSRGVPLKARHIARITGFQSADFELLIAWAASDHIGWLEPLGAAEMDRMFGDGAVCPGEKQASGESPDDPPTLQENPPSTSPDLTRPDLTRPNQSAAARAAAAAEAAKLALAGLDLEHVTTQANRLLHVNRDLPREFVWRASCACEAISPGMIADIATKLKTGDIRRPKSYIETALRRECDRLELDWRTLMAAAPPPPRLAAVSPDPPSEVAAACADYHALRRSARKPAG